MATSPHLSLKLRDALGPEAGDELIGLVDKAASDMSDLRGDVAELRHQMELGFARVDARFVELERRMDVRFAEMERTMDARFAGMDARFAGMDARFAGMDARFAAMDVRFAEIEVRFAQIDVRFAELERTMDARFAAIDTKFADLAMQMEKQTNRLILWSFAFWVTTLGVLLAVLLVPR